jgi:hypothetical protein
MPEMFFLSESDAAVLRRVIASERNRTVNPIQRTAVAENRQPAASSYLVVTPAGGIPAMSPSTLSDSEGHPGFDYCTLLGIQESYQPPELLPGGDNQVLVYNILTTAIPGNQAVAVTKTRQGQWVAVTLLGQSVGGGVVWVPYTGPPQSFAADEMTRDGDWTMIANTATTDRPAPQPSGPEEDLLPAWTPTRQTASGSYTVYNEWTTNTAGWVDQYGADVIAQNVGVQHVITLRVNGVVKDTFTATPAAASLYLHDIVPVVVLSGDVLRVTLQVTGTGSNSWYQQPALFATPPTYCSLAVGAKDAAAPGTTAYGCHLLFIPGTKSPDWDVVAFGGSPSGGGGGGGGGTGTVTGVATTAPITGGPITTSGTIAHAASGVTAGTYTSVSVDTFGHVTGGSNPAPPAPNPVWAKAVAYWNFVTFVPVTTVNSVWTKFSAYWNLVSDSAAFVRQITVQAPLVGTPSTIVSVGTIGHQTSGVKAGKYTNATITVDQWGHVTQANTGTSTPPGVTAVTATAPLASSGGTVPNISMTGSGVVAGTYNSVTVSGFGLVTAGTVQPYLTSVYLTGDVTGSGPGTSTSPVTTTLQSVAANVGTYTYATVTVDVKGRVTAAASGAAPPAAPAQLLRVTKSYTDFKAGTLSNGNKTSSIEVFSAAMIAGRTVLSGCYRVLTGMSGPGIVGGLNSDMIFYSNQTGPPPAPPAGGIALFNAGDITVTQAATTLIGGLPVFLITAEYDGTARAVIDGVLNAGSWTNAAAGSIEAFLWVA